MESFFVLSTYFWPWSVVDIPSTTLLEESSVSFLNVYPLHIASALAAGLCPFRLSTGILSGLHQCRSYACCCNLCEFMCASLAVSGNSVSLELFTTSVSHNLSTSPSASIPVPLGEELDEGILFRAECSGSLCFL